MAAQSTPPSPRGLRGIVSWGGCASSVHGTWWVVVGEKSDPRISLRWLLSIKTCVSHLLLSPPGPQLLLQALQVPQTPHWHSELEAAGGEDPPGDIIISDENVIQADNFEFIGGYYNTQSSSSSRFHRRQIP